VREARRLADQPYTLGGRHEPDHPGVDCMGLVFAAYQVASGTPWRRHSYLPTQLAARGTLGKPVPGLECVGRERIDYSLLQPGDIVLVLRHKQNPKEPPFCKLDGRDAWVWHMGIFTGAPENRFLHADPFHGVVSEVPLGDHLSNVWLSNQGISVLRSSL
jgi:cell wall-associated NlpC family hydrolase